MRKLKLDFDELAVESFDTGGEGGKGTVRAHGTVIPECPTAAGTWCGCPAGTWEYVSCLDTECQVHSCNDECYTDYCGNGTQYTNCHGLTCDGTCPVDTCPQ